MPLPKPTKSAKLDPKADALKIKQCQSAMTLIKVCTDLRTANHSSMTNRFSEYIQEKLKLNEPPGKTMVYEVLHGDRQNVDEMHQYLTALFPDIIGLDETDVEKAMLTPGVKNYIEYIKDRRRDLNRIVINGVSVPRTHRLSTRDISLLDGLYWGFYTSLGPRLRWFIASVKDEHVELQGVNPLLYRCGNIFRFLSIGSNEIENSVGYSILLYKGVTSIKDKKRDKFCLPELFYTELPQTSYEAQDFDKVRQLTLHGSWPHVEKLRPFLGSCLLWRMDEVTTAFTGKEIELLRKLDGNFIKEFIPDKHGPGKLLKHYLDRDHERLEEMREDGEEPDFLYNLAKNNKREWDFICSRLEKHILCNKFFNYFNDYYSQRHEKQTLSVNRSELFPVGIEKPEFSNLPYTLVTHQGLPHHWFS